jgi:hypothetical protein
MPLARIELSAVKIRAVLQAITSSWGAAVRSQKQYDRLDVWWINRAPRLTSIL